MKKMKKILLVVLMFIVVNNIAHAQDKLFELTSSGFVSTNSKTPDYQVVNFDGITQQELFDKILITVNSLYVSPQDVVSTVEEKSITVNGFGRDVVRHSMGALYDLNYTISFEFRDDRVRVNAPSVNRMINTLFGKFNELVVCEKIIPGTGKFTIFRASNGNLVSPKAKESLENHINQIIDTILNSRSESEDW